jgi:hypothetical protein
MRLSLILGVCVVLCCGAVAQATLMNVVVNSTDTQLPAGQTNGEVYSNVLNYTRTPNALGTSLDEIQIYLNNIEAMGASGLQALEGTWTITSGAEVIQTSILGQTPWYKYADSTYAPILISSFNAPASYVNLPYNSSTGVTWAQTPGGLAGNFTSGTAAGQSDTSVYGSWYTGGTALADGSLMATFFVHAGDNVSFHSTLNADQRAIGGWGLSGSVERQGDFATAVVPEPASLFLVASGLVGLLCYAWRKRR